MLRSDADSGNSSCSAGSGVAPPGAPRRATREASTNTELRVQDHPGARAPPAHRLLSPARLFPADRRHFTSSHYDIHRTLAEPHLNVASRRGGLTNAFSTIDLISSTQIEQRPGGSRHNLDGVPGREPIIHRGGVSRLRVRKQPVQRAASRLYRAGVVQGRDSEMCVGPEFIVRSTHPSKRLDISCAVTNSGEKRTVVVILLNGQKIDVTCDPSTTSAGDVFQAIIQLERFEHNFMLGISALVGGDFVFLPDDYKIRKVAPEHWCECGTIKRKTPKKNFISKDGIANFTLFLRIKFFMPPNLSKVVRGGVWRNWVYLQLRRSIVEGQITLQLPQLIELTGYALQAEFGNYSQRDHAAGDYYVLEHYLPEGSICGDENQVRILIKQAHQNCKNLSAQEAKEKLISIVQIFKDYGSHFYTAIWATRDGFARDVWLSISPRGMILYSRNTCITALPRDTHIANIGSRILLQSLAWQHIHTLHYNKRTLYVIPNDKASSGSAVKSGLKFKLKMDLNKSYFTFYLASLHHRFYMRLHADINSLLNISDEFSIPLNKNTNLNKESIENVVQNPWIDECSNFQDSYNIAVRGHLKMFKPKPPDNHKHGDQIEEIQNKENEKPYKVSDKMKRKSHTPIHSKSPDMGNASSSEVLSSPESCSLPRRLGVKMGTRAFNGSNHSTAYQHKQFHSLDATHLDKLNQLTISPERLVQSDIEFCSNHSDSDDPYNEQKAQHCNINKMNILPPRTYKSDVNSSSQMQQAYVIDSPQINNNTFIYQSPNDDTLVNSSLQDKLNSLSCVQSERFFKTVSLQRGPQGALGMQVAEGSDGNVYVKSITPGGPAAKLKQINPGDQIISVNGQTLLNLNYNKALSLLQQAPNNVEIILLQSITTNENQNSPRGHKVLSRHHSSPGNIVANLLNSNSLSKLSIHNKAIEINDNPVPSTSYSDNQKEPKKVGSQLNNDMLNVEALKTINVLLALTKRNIEKKISPNNERDNNDHGYKNNCISEHTLDQIDTYQYSSSTESTPSKKHNRNKNHSFNMIQENKVIKRRPLSVHIPSNVDLFETLDSTGNSLENGFSFRTRSCDNITILKANSTLNNANSLTQLKLVPLRDTQSVEQNNIKSQTGSQKNIAFSRKWAGHMKYPVTPSKIVTLNLQNNNDGIPNEPSNQFVYRNSLSDDEQIFI